MTLAKKQVMASRLCADPCPARSYLASILHVWLDDFSTRSRRPPARPVRGRPIRIGAWLRLGCPPIPHHHRTLIRHRTNRTGRSRDIRTTDRAGLRKPSGVEEPETRVRYCKPAHGAAHPQVRVSQGPLELPGNLIHSAGDREPAGRTQRRLRRPKRLALRPRSRVK